MNCHDGEVNGFFTVILHFYNDIGEQSNETVPETELKASSISTYWYLDLMFLTIFSNLGDSVMILWCFYDVRLRIHISIYLWKDGISVILILYILSVSTKLLNAHNEQVFFLPFFHLVLVWSTQIWEVRVRIIAIAIILFKF